MKFKVHLILTNTISVDCLRPVKFSALLSIIYTLSIILFNLCNINNLTADALLLRSLKVATAKLTSQLYLIWLRPYFHLTIYLGPWSVLSAVSVLTAQLSMSSLNIYHQFMLFRDSLPKVRFTRSPLAKRIKFKIN